VTVPIADPRVSDTAKEAVADVLDSGMLAAGQIVSEFESEFAAYVGVDHAVATSSGTTGLQVMLEAAGISKGETVLTSPFSFISSANAIRHTGASVAFADIDSETYNLDPAAVRGVLAERADITALMPVHLYGLPAAMDEFRSIADEYDLMLFEDAAQAHGGRFGGEMAGSLGDAGTFSFYPTKNMTTGEGGMITTDDETIANRARKLINHGRDGKYSHEAVGYNFRMTDVKAAIGREQLKRLSNWVEKRRENARRLSNALERTGVNTPTVPEGLDHAFHQYTIRSKARDRLTSTLDERDIGYGIYYPTPIPEQQPYSEFGPNPVALSASEEVLSLPVHQHVDESDIQAVVAAVREVHA